MDTQIQTLKQTNLAGDVQRAYQAQGPLCNSEGFYNHEGECWNDALQMIFLYSDGLKEIVQKKLAEAHIDPMEVDTLFRPFLQSKVNALVKNKNIKNEDVVQLGLTYISLVYEYLQATQRRFYRHYMAETTRVISKRVEKLCGADEGKGLKALEELKKISLLFRAKGREGVRAGLYGQTLKLENITKKRIPEKLSNVYEPGGSQETRANVIEIFKTFFSLPVQVNEFLSGNNLFGDRFSQSGTAKHFEITSNTIALYCGVLSERTGHAVAFYRCGGREYYYDDNHGTIQFPWSLYFNHLQDPMTTEMKEHRNQWMRKYKFKYPTNDDELMDYKFLLDAELHIFNSEMQSLFKTTSYPYISRLMYETTSGAKSNVEVFTYLFNGQLIKFSTLEGSFPFEHTTTVETNTGEKLIIKLKIEIKASKTYLKRIYPIDFTGTLEHSPSAKVSGTFLGSRIRGVDSIVEKILFEQQLEKVREGKAKIDDIFYEDEYTPLLYAIMMKDKEMIDQALEAGANIHKRTLQETPLFFALTNDFGLDLEIVEYLLKKGADKDLNDDTNLFRGLTPLIGSIAFNNPEDISEVVTLLVSYGANINQPSKENNLPIEYAVFFKAPNDVIDTLVKLGAPKPTCFTKQILLKRVNGDSLVMYWIRQENVIKATILAKCCRELELYEDLNHENMVGDTALKLAMHLRDSAWAKELIDVLLFNGADPNHIDRTGMTPLYYAIQLGKVSVVEKLFDYNVNPYITVEGLGTPLEYAKRLGRSSIVEDLEEALAYPKYKNTKRFKHIKATRKAPNYSKKYAFKKRATKRAINKAKAAVLNSSK